MAMAVFQILTPLMPSLGIGEPIGSQSDSVRTLITPAGWAFSIWGALYTGSLAFAVYQILPSQHRSALLEQVRWPAAGSFLGNALWAAYTQVYGLSFVSALIIIFTLTCLLVIYRRFSDWRFELSQGERWLAVLPLSALTAWLTVATIVNIAASLRFHGVGAGEYSAVIAAGVVVVGGAIGSAAVIAGKGNLPYALVFLWALVAIFSSGGQASVLVASAAALSSALIIAATFIGMRRSEEKL